MAKKLPARPNLEHLRGQAKTRLAELKKRNARARLADAQLAVARECGFKSWPALTRHVEHLRALEGEWRFLSLEIEGSAVPRGKQGVALCSVGTHPYSNITHVGSIPLVRACAEERRHHRGIEAPRREVGERTRCRDR